MNIKRIVCDHADSGKRRLRSWRWRLLDHVRDDVAQPQVKRIRHQHRLAVDRLANKTRRVRYREAETDDTGRLRDDQRRERRGCCEVEANGTER